MKNKCTRVFKPPMGNFEFIVILVAIAIIGKIIEHSVN